MNAGDLWESVNKIFTVEELKKEVAVLAKQYKIESAYLFGSYARGEATADNDVDVLVIGGSAFHLTDNLHLRKI